MNRIQKAAQWLLGINKRDIDSRTPRGFNLLFGGSPTSSGKQVSERTALTLSAIYHAVDLISSDFGSLPQKVYSYSDAGKDIKTDHTAYKLLNVEPNYYQTPFDFSRTMAVFRLLYGNAYAYIHRNGQSGMIENLIPIHPDNVSKIVEEEMELFYHTKEYGVVPGSDMIHVKDLSIETSEEYKYMGKSRVDMCAETIGKGLALNEFAATFFGNGANFGMIFESELGAFEDEDQRKNFLKSVQSYQGSNAANLPFAPPEGVKVSQAARPTQDRTQYIETNIFHVQEVAQIFNLPLHKMRIDSNGNSYASLEQANMEYINDTLKPFAVAFEQEYNKKLFRENEKGSVFVETSMKQKKAADLDTLAGYVDTMLKNGTFSVNQALEELGENTIGPIGDDRYIQSNQMKLGQTPIQDGEENN